MFRSPRPEPDCCSDVVSRPYELTSLIVTTNNPFKKWNEVLGSERLMGELLDRLPHCAHILEANGESHLLTDAKCRLKTKVNHTNLQPQAGSG